MCFAPASFLACHSWRWTFRLCQTFGGKKRKEKGKHKKTPNKSCSHWCRIFCLEPFPKITSCVLLHLQVNKNILWGNSTLQRQKQMCCYCMSLTGGCESALIPSETRKVLGREDSEFAVSIALSSAAPHLTGATVQFLAVDGDRFNSRGIFLAWVPGFYWTKTEEVVERRIDYF